MAIDINKIRLDIFGLLYLLKFYTDKGLQVENIPLYEEGKHYDLQNSKDKEEIKIHKDYKPESDSGDGKWFNEKGELRDWFYKRACRLPVWSDYKDKDGNPLSKSEFLKRFKDTPLLMLNKPKYDALIRGDIALKSVARDGIAFFTLEALKKAKVGTGVWTGKRTTELGDNNIVKEEKVLLNLDFAEFTRLNVPPEIFKYHKEDISVEEVKAFFEKLFGTPMITMDNVIQTALYEQGSIEERRERAQRRRSAHIAEFLDYWGNA